MLTLLSLKDFVIVRTLTIEAKAGLTCLTGETGAGKSILIDALELVLGARSDTGVIREGAERTEVTAEFSATPRASAWLEAAELTSEDGVLLLRRTVDVKGRSRCWINGTPVTVSQMKELGERLVDIHGQHAHQSLLKPSHQLQLVDGFSNVKPQLLAVKAAWDAWQKTALLLKQATEDRERLQAESEKLSWMNEILAELNPREGEWDKVSDEHSMLSNAADILTNVRGALENLTDSSDSASNLLTRAHNELVSASKYDETYAEYAESIQQACTIIDDCSRDIGRHLDHCDLDEGRFEEVDERLNAYWRISRKFHRAPDELFTLWEETKKRLSEIEESADLDGLRLKEAADKKVFLAKAAELTALRNAGAAKLSKAVTAEMQTLSMAGGRLEVTLPACEPWAGGVERCEFLVSGHAGATPRALTKVASGGELARISLAIAVITAQITPVPTLIFDEVDSGIGGAIAEVVGRLLRRLGTSRQVLCVTHLPQVAACGNNQWKVMKKTEHGETVSHLTDLTPAERVDEIARMAGGTVITEATRSAAAEMLAAAEK